MFTVSALCTALACGDALDVSNGVSLSDTTGSGGNNTTLSNQRSVNIVRGVKPKKDVDWAVRPCAKDSDYRHLASDQCLPRFTSWGYAPFDWPVAPDKPNVTCDPGEFEKAVERDLDDGGLAYVLLPVGCDMALPTEVTVTRDNMIIDGGSTRTTLRTNAVTSMRINGRKNVVLRRLTLDGQVTSEDQDTVRTLVEIDDFSDNVLVEHIVAKNVYMQHFRGNNASRVTYRYNWLDQSQKFHGIQNDEGYENVAIYSNYVTRTGQVPKADGYGINSHGSMAEICGNYLEENKVGVKVQDANGLLFHHNHIVGSTGSSLRGVRTAWDRSKRSAKQPKDQLFYANYIDTGSRDHWAFNFSDLKGGFLVANRFGTVADSVSAKNESGADTMIFSCLENSENDVGGIAQYGEFAPIAAGQEVFPAYPGLPAFDPCMLP